MSLLQHVQVIQRLYEKGKLSYPRTAETALAEQAQQTLRTFARAQRLPLRSTRIGGGAVLAHEALHPTDDGIEAAPLRRPSWMLDEEGRAMQAIVKHYVDLHTRAEIEVPDLTDAPDWARGLEWSREASLSGEDERPSGADAPEMVDYTPGVVAFLALCRAGLGQPSTLVEHARRLVDRGFIDGNGLTASGRRAADSAPPLSVASSQHAEETLEQAHRASLRGLGASTDDLLAQVLAHFEPSVRHVCMRTLETAEPMPAMAMPDADIRTRRLQEDSRNREFLLESLEEEETETVQHNMDVRARSVRGPSLNHQG